MAVSYEWDVELVCSKQTEDYEVGECVDHNHCASYADAVRAAEKAAPDGFEHNIVLVRDDAEGRSWAYMEAGQLLPFIDAEGVEVAKVPQKFSNEVAKHGR